MEAEISVPGNPGEEPDQIQPLVQNLMQTILEDFPSLLTESDRGNLMDKDYCRDQMGFNLHGVALLRHQGDGVEISGHARYYIKVYAGRYHVTNNWWRQDHRHNAEALLRWVERLIQRSSGQSAAALEHHRAAFRDYLGLSG